MNWELCREEFPVTQQYLYFDLANKCALPRFTTQEIEAYIHAQQQTGGDKEAWFATIASAREKVARLIGAHSDEVAFTKNTSEALNLAANGLPLKAGDTVLLNGHEHPNNIYCWLNLERRGVRVRWIPSNGGGITVEDIAAHCDESTKVLAIAATNYSPGNRNDLAAIGRFCRQRGIYTVIDAVQSVGVVQMDVHSFDIDILCSSGHKYLFCPHGVGIFYCRKELLSQMIPWVAARNGMGMAAQIEKDCNIYQLEFSNDARQFEIGNYNYLGLSVLEKTVGYLLDIGMDKVEARILSLGALLIEQLEAAGCTVLTPHAYDQRAAIVCFSHRDTPGLYKWLASNRVVMTLRRDTIRLSLGIYNNEEDIGKLIGLIRAYGAT